MTCTLLCGCCGSDCGTADASLDYAAINAQAAEQYLRPIRPGYEGRNPFWNGFAKKFIYAPAFDFDEVAGAANYRFTVVPLGEETQASWSFTADSPKAALTPVWGEIPGRSSPASRSRASTLRERCSARQANASSSATIPSRAPIRRRCATTARPRSWACSTSTGCRRSSTGPSTPNPI